MGKTNIAKEEIAIIKLKSYISNLEEYCKKDSALIHASNLLKKSRDCIKKGTSTSKVQKLLVLLPEYLKYLNNQKSIACDISNCSSDSFCNERKPAIDADIEKRVELLNKYYRFFEDKEIESDKGFDSRSKIRSTILEEFMYFLFNDFVSLLLKESGMNRATIKNGHIEAYSNLYFTASDINKYIQSPSIGLNTKQQDYAIYREVDISAASSKKTAKIPILAIENKTFLDKTMLEGAIETAEKTKMGSPYSVYIVATETYAVKFDVDPVFSRIDQIFVLRKCKQDKNNRLPKDIDNEVVKTMYWYVVKKLLRPWSAIEKRLSESGTII